MLEKQDKNDPAQQATGDGIGVEDVRAERAVWEAEKMTRRAALARVGLRFGAAALAAFTVDDLARATMKALDRRAQDGRIAGEVAKEFRNAGVAFADPPGSTGPPQIYTPCQNCDRHYESTRVLVCNQFNGTEYTDCVLDLRKTRCRCYKNNSCPQAASLPDQCADCTLATC